MNEITTKIDQIGRLIQEVREYKAAHPESVTGYYLNNYGSLLNAYREGDLGFDECVALLGRVDTSKRLSDDSICDDIDLVIPLVKELTAYQALVYVALYRHDIPDPESAIKLVAKHAKLIEDRERRRFEPAATARAIIEQESAGQPSGQQSGLSRYERALIFAARAHGNQRRKYTNEPYLNHPIAVAGMLADAGFDEDVVIAGMLHDVVEDTSIVYGDIRMDFGAHVADLVLAVSDISKPTDGNREARKAKDREHLANAGPEAQSLKVCDLISNTPSIVEHDPAFAKIYLAEKRALLAVLTRADRNLLRRAWEVLEAGEKTNLRDLTR